MMRTQDEWRREFQNAHPKAVDFLDTEYRTSQNDVDAIAAEFGYHLVGVRLGRAVFSTKPRAAAPRNPQVDET